MDIIHTSSYRPQSNGVVERLHGTLKHMLSKAVDNSKFLPLALFAIRQAVCSSTGFLLHELVYGRQMRNPLDLLWVDEVYKEVDVSRWVVSLQEKLRLLHELAMAKEKNVKEKRAIVYDKNKSERELVVVEELVLVRVPGLMSEFKTS